MSIKHWKEYVNRIVWVMSDLYVVLKPRLYDRFVFEIKIESHFPRCIGCFWVLCSYCYTVRRTSHLQILVCMVNISGFSWSGFNIVQISYILLQILSYQVRNDSCENCGPFNWLASFVVHIYLEIIVQKPVLTLDSIVIQ
jgi:hypothetical protein